MRTVVVVLLSLELGDNAGAMGSLYTISAMRGGPIIMRSVHAQCLPSSSVAS